MVEIIRSKPSRWVHGREIWKEMIGDTVLSVSYEDWHCSNCNCVVEESKKPTWNYCPNCGAQMEET